MADQPAHLGRLGRALAQLLVVAALCSGFALTLLAEDAVGVAAIGVVRSGVKGRTARRATGTMALTPMGTPPSRVRVIPGRRCGTSSACNGERSNRRGTAQLAMPTNVPKVRGSI